MRKVLIVAVSLIYLVVVSGCAGYLKNPNGYTAGYTGKLCAKKLGRSEIHWYVCK